jgi:protein-tyrosine-phosphatase
VNKKQRIYGLGIWGLGLGYFLFYTPYSGLTRALSSGILPGAQRPLRGTILLPASIAAVAVGMLGFITVMKWWKYAGHREFFKIRIPFPRRLTFLSGICMAIIMGTTTLAFAFKGVSIVLVLVLLRGGVLIIAPLVDSLVGRRVRWFCWVAMVVSLIAVLVVLGDAANYKLNVTAMITIAAYLTAYFIKFQLMSALAKTNDEITTLRYFVEEQMVASPLLLLVLAAMATIGIGDAMMGLRIGFTTFLASREAGFALLIGFFYAGLCICTTLIFLDRRENTFCVPMHCGFSMLAGVAATYALSFASVQAPPSESQLVSSGLIVMALVFLSPLHHFQRSLGKLRSSLAGIRRWRRGFVIGSEKPDSVILSGETMLAPNFQLTKTELEGLGHFDKLRKAFLFVCSGNTCRSPIAAAIGNAEIAARFQISVAALDPAKLPALSAGISVSIGAPMTLEAQQALRLLGVPALPHKARNLTVELAHEVERIFCMTQAHRNAVINLVPAAAAKTHCLDPEGDVEDPIGRELTTYINCARRIHSLVQLRFDEIGLPVGGTRLALDEALTYEPRANG